MDKVCEIEMSSGDSGERRLVVVTADRFIATDVATGQAASGPTISEALDALMMTPPVTPS